MSLRIRCFGELPLDLTRLPALPRLQALAVEARSVSGVASLASSQRLQALEVVGALGDDDVSAIGRLASLRELRVWPRGPESIARFRAVRQIERLHTRANPRVLAAFDGAPLTRLVLSGEANLPVLRALSRFTSLRVLDVVLHEDLSERRLLALRSLRSLETLLIAWRYRAPRLPRLPSLGMLVVDGEVDRDMVRWMAAQPRLRTVHTALANEDLAPLLPRARPYEIGRPGQWRDLLPSMPLEHAHVGSLGPLDQTTVAVGQAITLGAHRGLDVGGGTFRARAFDGALRVYFSPSGQRDDEALFDFLRLDSPQRGVARATLLEDERILVRLEPRAGGDGRVRVVLSEIDPMLGLVVRNVWSGTRRSVRAGRAPAWTHLSPGCAASAATCSSCLCP